MPTPRPALIFDLDGTLTDSKPGIVACLQKVLDDRGIGDQGPLDRFVGPPVEEWTATLLPHATAAARLALADDYRACYNSEGWQNNSTYPGIREVLAELRQLDFPLFVCTSKRQNFAERILEHFDLSRFFTAIYADRSDYSSHSKVDLLALLLRERSLHPGPATPTPWMIGDRIFDIQAARVNGIRSIAAAWGYGDPAEWALADRIARSAADLPSCILDPTAKSATKSSDA